MPGVAPDPQSARLEDPAAETVTPGRGAQLLREITTGNAMISVLAVVAALFLGAVLIGAADPKVQNAATYLFARPGDFGSALWGAVSNAYSALFQGAVYDFDAQTFARAIRPLTETMTMSVPLIFAGLGLAIGFRAGLFNIGAQGQIILGAIFGGYIGFAWHLPIGLHLLLALIGAMLGGAIWASIAGVLKARTGAHEVIVTIMLNNIAIYLIAYVLTLKAFKRPGSTNPISPFIDSSAQYPLLLGSGFRLHAGFLLALAAAVGGWWLMNRSTPGFTFRAVGANPSAARTAGMSVTSTYISVSYTHLRAHETRHDLVCRLLLEKKK